jgi:hypothetical protein
VNCCGVPVSKEPVQSAASTICGACAIKGRKVENITVEHILKLGYKEQITDTQYYFCKTPSCDVVYFSNETQQYFIKEDLRVRVWLKEMEDTIPICYCFDHSAASVRDEIARTGRSTVVPSITAEIDAGNCSCEVKNPSGHCCLGEVSKLVTGLLEEQGPMIRRSCGPARGDSKINVAQDCCAFKDN